MCVPDHCVDVDAKQDGEDPAVHIRIDSFYIDMYEVSNDAFTEFVKATSFRTEVSKPLSLFVCNCV
jgi:formylglycine-generating enzyme required for sulfatase activity